MNAHRQDRFNMIEITLALLIIAVGVTSIFGLVPWGMQQHRNARYQNSAADGAEYLLHYLSSEIQSDPDWSDGATGIALSEPPDISSITEDIGSWTLTRDNLYWDSGGIYRIYKARTVPTDDEGNTRRMVDLDAIVRVWASATETMEWGGGTSNDMTNRVILNAEIIWPARWDDSGDFDYDRCQTEHFTMEVIREP